MGSSPTGSTVCPSADPGCLCATAPKLWASKRCQRRGIEPQWLEQWSYEPEVVGSSPTGSTVCTSADPGCLCATAPKLWASKHRQRGGIEPLCITAPRELKSRPGTSLSHPGLCEIAHRFRGNNHVIPKCPVTRARLRQCARLHVLFLYKLVQVYIGSPSSVVRAMVL